MIGIGVLNWFRERRLASAKRGMERDIRADLKAGRISRARARALLKRLPAWRP